jgi:hypothetical protein
MINQFKMKQDKFYTIVDNLPDIEEYLELNTGAIYLEPAVGSGNLLALIPGENYVAFDLYPDDNSIVTEAIDFLTTQLDYYNYITIMNSPYGTNANLAIKFFNHAAKYSKKIVCIVPLTFNKISVINKLSTDFSLIFNETLPKNSFTFNNKPYNVPTCIQVWNRANEPRILQKTKLTTDLFDFGTFEDYTIAVRRAGSKAGKIVEVTKKVEGIFWIKCNEQIKELIASIDFSDIVINTVGVKSLSKHEFITRVEYYANHSSLN